MNLFKLVQALVSLFAIPCTFLLGCSSSGTSNASDIADDGGVTDIGNAIELPPDKHYISGKVIDDQGNGVPHIRVVYYNDLYGNVVDSLETFTDSAGKFVFVFDLHDGRVIRIGDDIHKTYYAFEDHQMNSVLYVESGDMSSFSGINLVRDHTMKLSKKRILRGSIEDKNSGYVRIAGTNLRADVDENGRFSLDGISSCDRTTLFYVENDTAKGLFIFSTLDERDTISLPPFEILEGNDGYMTISDMFFYGAYGITSYSPSFVLTNKYREIPKEVSFMVLNSQVYDDDSTVAENISHVTGFRGYESAVSLMPGQFINLDSIDPTIGNFTVSFWTKWNGPNDYDQVLFCQRDYGKDSSLLFLWYYDADRDAFAVMKTGGDSSDVVLFGKSKSVPIGERVFISLVSKKGMVSMYVNGELIGEPRAFVRDELDREVPMRIGSDGTKTRNWNGIIDELWVETYAHSREYLRAKYEYFVTDQWLEDMKKLEAHE